MVGVDVSTAVTVNLTATSGASTMTRPVTVNPSAVDTLTLSVNPISSGQTTTATVTLPRTVTVNTVVTIEYARDWVATGPTTITILAGNRSKNFTITARTVTAISRTNVTASRLGQYRRVTLTVNP